MVNTVSDRGSYRLAALHDMSSKFTNNLNKLIARRDLGRSFCSLGEEEFASLRDKEEMVLSLKIHPANMDRPIAQLYLQQKSADNNQVRQSKCNPHQLVGEN